MSARALPLLTAVALSGCFADSGFDPATTGGPTGPGTSTTTQSITTGPDPSTSSDSSAATTEAPATTGDASATTTSSTSGAPPVCVEPAACVPGTSEQIGACGTCSARVHTCEDDCQWGPDVCEQSAEGCGYWVYDPGKFAWGHVAPAGGAPTAPARAAFALTVDDALVVLTADSYYVYHAQTNSWSPPAALADAFPGQPQPVLHAYALWDALANNYTVTLVSDGAAHIYTLTSDGPPAKLVKTVPCCEGWTVDVPDPGLANVRDIFIDLQNAHAWAQADITLLCGLDSETPLGGYGAWVLPDSVIVQEVGYCFDMAYQTPYAEFPPFAQAGAPPGSLVGGVTLLGGRLYVFAGD